MRLRVNQAKHFAHRMARGRTQRPARQLLRDRIHEADVSLRGERDHRVPDRLQRGRQQLLARGQLGVPLLHLLERKLIGAGDALQPAAGKNPDRYSSSKCQYKNELQESD